MSFASAQGSNALFNNLTLTGNVIPSVATNPITIAGNLVVTGTFTSGNSPTGPTTTLPSLIVTGDTSLEGSTSVTGQFSLTNNFFEQTNVVGTPAAYNGSTPTVIASTSSASNTHFFVGKLNNYIQQSGSTGALDYVITLPDAYSTVTPVGVIATLGYTDGNAAANGTGCNFTLNVPGVGYQPGKFTLCLQALGDYSVGGVQESTLTYICFY